MVRPVLAVLAALAAIGLGAPLSAFPAATPSAPQRVVAVGDLHGDFAAWTAIARAAGLVDARGHWAGGRTILVQTGDVVDRGPDSIDILHQLQSLQREAPRAGGKVVPLVGNHEAMNMIGDLRYVSAGEYAGFVNARSAARRDAYYAAHQAAIEAAAKAHDATLTPSAIRDDWIKTMPLGRVEHDAAWAPQGSIGRWVVGNAAVAIVDGTLFVHGGISPKFASLAPADINRRVKEALLAQDASDGAIINDPLGPLWYRGLIVPDPTPGTTTAEQQVSLALKAQEATRIVVGHTPIVSGISVRLGGRLVDIDTGISSAYGGKLSYLEINGDALSVHDVPRPAPTARGQ